MVDKAEHDTQPCGRGGWLGSLAGTCEVIGDLGLLARRLHPNGLQRSLAGDLCKYLPFALPLGRGGHRMGRGLGGGRGRGADRNNLGGGPSLHLALL